MHRLYRKECIGRAVVLQIELMRPHSSPQLVGFSSLQCPSFVPIRYDGEYIRHAIIYARTFRVDIGQKLWLTLVAFGCMHFFMNVSARYDAQHVDLFVRWHSVGDELCVDHERVVRLNRQHSTRAVCMRRNLINVSSLCVCWLRSWFHFA